MMVQVHVVIKMNTIYQLRRPQTECESTTLLLLIRTVTLIRVEKHDVVDETKEYQRKHTQEYDHSHERRQAFRKM